MPAATHAVALDGLAGRAVEVEVDLADGQPSIAIVGLADAMVNEARDRVRSAVVNSGTSWPEHRVTINLAPSNLPKSGSHFDLAIAVAVFAVKNLVPAEELADTVFLGELALDGRLRAVRGVLPATLAAARAGFGRVVVPDVNAAEARLVPDVDVIGVRSLRQTIALFTGDEEPDDPPVPPLQEPADATWAASAERTAMLDLHDVAGQEDAKLAVLVAAAGGHHLLMTGPPGIGKTMLAQRLPGLLPDLGVTESLEVSAIHSVAGLLPAEAPLLVRPPFVSPHHTASLASVVGGGSRVIRPGALSLAHHGVLFFDEAPEFAINVVNSLRQPLEDGTVTIGRSRAMTTFPARFQLILAANPCPCGHAGAAGEHCGCSPLMRRKYAGKISGPIRDRIDIHRELTSPSRAQLAALTSSPSHGRSTAEFAQLVREARERQLLRYAATPWRLNSQLPGAELRRNWPMEESARLVIERQVATARISARAADRISRLAWSVADLCAHPRPTTDDVDTALSLRRGTGIGGPLRELVEVAA